METYERIRELRKNHLKMSQAAFAARLGTSRDVIKNIELNALKKPDQKLSLMKLICNEFNVSEDWLLDGVGEMFVETPQDVMGRLVAEFDLDEFAAGAVLEYLKLDDDRRAMLRDFVARLMPYLDLAGPADEHKGLAEMSIDEKVDDYRRQLEAKEKAEEKSQVLRRDA